MAIDYGQDLSCLDDLEEEMRVVTDPKTLLAQALIRRWSTPRGMLLDDPDYGYDISENVNEDLDALSLARIRSESVAEALKDERVVECTVPEAFFDTTTNRLKLTFAVEAVGIDGALRLKVEVSDVTVTLLSVE